MEKVDITVKRDGASPITLTFTESEPDAARERFEFLSFILRPFVATEKKPVEKSQPKAVPPRPAASSGEPK